MASESFDFDRYLQSTFGDDASNVMGLLEQPFVDDVELAQAVLNGDVGAVIKRRVPGLAPNDCQAFTALLSKVGSQMNQFALGLAASLIGPGGAKPNSAVTLYATSAGTPCNVYSVTPRYDLKPRSAGVLEPDAAQFDSETTLIRFISPEDTIHRDFHLIGAGGLDTDRISPFRKDTNFSAFLQDLPLGESPFTTLRFSRPKERTKMLFGIYLDGVAPRVEHFPGITITYQEMGCMPFMRNLQTPSGVAPSTVAENLRARLVSRMRTGGAAGGGLLGLNSTLR
jgi:hypothetical protein